jgi:NADH-quinone oxidoreductase subunit G
LERIIAHSNGQGVFRVEVGAEVTLPGAKDLALRSERAANVAGARLLGFTQTSAPLAPLRDGDALLVVGEMLEGLIGADFDRAATIVHIGTTLPDVLAARAQVVLPISNILEEEGTLTNVRGRVQRFLQAKAAPGVARPSWYVLADVLAALGGLGAYETPAQVFEALSASSQPFSTLDYDALGLLGLPLLDEAAAVSEVTA